MSIAARFRETPSAESRSDRAEPKRALFVSVIVPVRDEAANIQSLLGELAAQQYDPDRFEVLVVDGDSDDGTPEIVEAFAAGHPNFRLLHNPKRLSSAARNVGIREAKGDVVVVVDGHCEIGTPHYIAHVAAAFEESKADILGRPQPLDITGATPLQRAVAAARNSRLGHHPESFIYSNTPQVVPAKSVGVAYRRHVFEEIGHFDETFDAHEDGEFNYRCDRAGLACYFTPAIAVRYHPRGSLPGLFRQMVRYGRGRVRLFRKHPETFELGTLLPVVFLLGLLLGPLVCLAIPLASFGYFGCLGLYGALTASVGLAAATSDGNPLIALYVPLAALTVHVGAGCGVLAELVQGSKQKQSPQSETVLVNKPR